MTITESLGIINDNTVKTADHDFLFVLFSNYYVSQNKLCGL